MHSKGSIEYSEGVKDLLNGMMAFDPEERPSIEEIKDHEWYLGEVGEISEIKKEFKRRFDKVQEFLKRKFAEGKGEYRAIGEEGELKWNKTGQISYDIQKVREMEWNKICHPYDFKYFKNSHLFTSLPPEKICNIFKLFFEIQEEIP
jgi:hypothetical protein